uniref:PH domain-containing protein n=1 Tax=Panagrellus redivivus TaxID=6233 RepID=A0A7E4VJR8_PANRE
MRQVLYQDSFVDLYADELIVKAYYFPYGDKSISTKHIRHVYYRQQAFFHDLFVTKDWGMTITPVWWARDFRRHIRIGKQTVDFNVVIDTGSSIKKGFSVKNIVAFLNALRTVTNAPFEADLPKHYDAKPKAVPLSKESKEKLSYPTQNATTATYTPPITLPLRPAPELGQEALPTSPEKDQFFFDEFEHVERVPNYASAPPAYAEHIKYPKLD